MLAVDIEAFASSASQPSATSVSPDALIVGMLGARRPVHKTAGYHSIAVRSPRAERLAETGIEPSVVNCIDADDSACLQVVLTIHFLGRITDGCTLRACSA
jgi:hypothetical protein